MQPCIEFVNTKMAMEYWTLFNEPYSAGNRKFQYNISLRNVAFINLTTTCILKYVFEV